MRSTESALTGLTATLSEAPRDRRANALLSTETTRSKLGLAASGLAEAV